MEINRINIRTWSMLGARRTFGTVMDAYANVFDKLFVMSGDLASSSGLDRFLHNHPEKFLSAGIAEQNMVGIASGLAAEGYVPFITSFSPFMTGRCYDHIRMHLGYMHHNVKLVGLAAGFGVGIQGNSHFGLDDVALMRAVPGLTIVEPADCTEVAKAVKAIYDYEGPVYLRLIGEAGSPVVNKADYDFELVGESAVGKTVISFSINRFRNTDEDDEEDNSTVVPFQVAYAISIHKAQGLEYDSVKIVITNGVEELITHNIFYTAITRTKNKLKIYWSPETEKYVLDHLEVKRTGKDASLLAQLSSISMSKNGV